MPPPRKKARTSQAASASPDPDPDPDPDPVAPSQPNTSNTPKKPTPAESAEPEEPETEPGLQNAPEPEHEPEIEPEPQPEPEPEPELEPEPTPSPAKDDEARLNNANDAWTDEEEIGLYKGIMRWKPTGIHKHFRLMALHAWLLEHRYIHPANAHTRTAGIWAKLNTMYDLAALDAREDARQLPRLENPLIEEGGMDVDKEEPPLADADAYSEADNKIDQEEFDPSVMEGLDEEMWRRRLPTHPEEADEDGDSEPELPEVNLAELPPVTFMPSFSIEPGEAATPSSRKSKGKSKGGRRSTGKTTDKGTRRSARQAESVADEEEASEEDKEEEAEDEAEEENEDEEEPSEEGQSQASTPAPRSTRAKIAKGRAAARGRGRGRSRK